MTLGCFSSFSNVAKIGLKVQKQYDLPTIDISVHTPMYIFQMHNLSDLTFVGETGVGCHTGWLSHCQYLIRWMAVPCGDLHVTCV